MVQIPLTNTTSTNVEFSYLMNISMRTVIL